jgi:hypothetical protein
MKKLIYTLVVLPLLTSVAYAQQKQLSTLRIQPVIGYNKANGQTMFIYGGRIAYGPRLYSVELEVTNGKNDYYHSSQNLKTEEKNLTGMLGIRSELSFFKGAFGAYGRAGAQGRQRELEYNQNGIITTDKQTYVAPYAGGGLTIRAFNLVSLTGGVTVVFKGEDHEYQTTLGVGFHF